MKTIFLFASVTFVFAAAAQNKDYPIQPVAFTHVDVNDLFWKPKMQVNAEETIPFILGKLKTQGRIDNFFHK